MISAIILTKNEEINIADCIKSVKWCDEIIVVDDNSIDKTVDIAAKRGAVVYRHDMNMDFARQRNYGLSKAKGEWVLFVDADERVSPSLWYEIMQYTNASFGNYKGFYIKRQDYIWGKKLKFGEAGAAKFIRLAKKDAGRWSGKVHEVWNIEGLKKTLEKELAHYPHQAIADFLKDINFYSTLRAKELYDKNIKVSWLSIIIFPIAKFFRNYFLKLGFLDGIPGIITALMMAFHSFLVRGKLWIMKNKNR